MPWRSTDILIRWMAPAYTIDKDGSHMRTLNELRSFYKLMLMLITINRYCHNSHIRQFREAASPAAIAAQKPVEDMTVRWILHGLSYFTRLMCMFGPVR